MSFNRQLLLKSLLPALISFSMVGCKSSSNGNRVTTARSNKGVAKTTPPPAQTSGTDAGEKSTDSTKKQALPCGEYSKKMEELGWESLILETTELNKKIKISYFIPKNSDLKNPVLVLPHSIDPMTEDLAQDILEAGKNNLFDPIVMEPRGLGCSEKLPDNKIEWNNFTAEKVAGDAEQLRKKLIQDRKWKVWAHQQSSVIALKMVEINPSSVKSLHIADFTFSKSPLEHEKLKLKTQIEAWKKFKEFSKQNDFELTAEVESKIKQTLLLDNKCPQEQRICKLELTTSLIDYISGDDSDWTEAIKALKLLSEGSIPEELNRIAQKNQKIYLYNQLLTAAHLDSDQYLRACENALNDRELKEDAAITSIKSCSIDQVLKNSYLSELRGKIQHKKMNFQVIQKNLKSSDIQLHLAVGERSLLNPLASIQDMAEMLTGTSDLENLFAPDNANNLFFETQLLGTLK